MSTIQVKGMSCQHCVASVTEALSALDGVKNVQVDLGKGEATYEEEGTVSPETIKEAISAIGFEAIIE